MSITHRIRNEKTGNLKNKNILWWYSYIKIAHNSCYFKMTYNNYHDVIIWGIEYVEDDHFSDITPMHVGINIFDVASRQL